MYRFIHNPIKGGFSLHNWEPERPDSDSFQVPERKKLQTIREVEQVGRWSA